MSPYTPVTKNLDKPAGAILGKKVDSGRSSLELDTAGMRNLVSLISMKNIRLIPTKIHCKLSCFKISNVFFFATVMAKKKRAQRWLPANAALSRFRLATQPQLSYKQALSAAIGVYSHLDMLGVFVTAYYTPFYSVSWYETDCCWYWGWAFSKVKVRLSQKRVQSGN